MNKTKYFILTLILCFSLVFAVYPLKALHGATIFSNTTPVQSSQTTVTGYYIGSGYAIPNPVSPSEPSQPNAAQDEQYSGWFCNPTKDSCFFGKKNSPGYDTQEQCEANCIYCRYCKKLFGFFGPYGCYGLKKCTNNIDICTTNGQCSSSGGEETTKYKCSTSGCVQDNTNGTYTTSNCDNKCVKRCVGTSCQYSDNTSNSICTYSSQCYNVSKYRCSSNSGCIASSSGGYTTSNCSGKCVKRCVGTSCQYNDNTANNTCTHSSQCVDTGIKYSCNENTGDCEEDSNGTTFDICDSNCPSIPSPSSEPCIIFDFSLPSKAWVDYPITGEWSASDWCEDCDISCTLYPDCVWQDESIGKDGEHSFTIEQSGNHSYTLRCYGEESEDFDVQTISVPAYNLPWWREIIPVLPDLQGFLKGIWR
jgi:hypothetical protein